MPIYATAITMYYVITFNARLSGAVPPWFTSVLALGARVVCELVPLAIRYAPIARGLTGSAEQRKAFTPAVTDAALSEWERSALEVPMLPSQAQFSGRV
jgi:hypothetical protein